MCVSLLSSLAAEELVAQLRSFASRQEVEWLEAAGASRALSAVAEVLEAGSSLKEALAEAEEVLSEELVVEKEQRFGLWLVVSELLAA